MSDVTSGNVHVINYGGDVFVKRLEKNPTTRAITLFLDNKKNEPIVINGKNLENCSIMGRVVAHIRKGVIFLKKKGGGGKLKFGFQKAKKCLDFCILSSHFLPYVHIYTKNALNAICSTFLPILTFLSFT